MPPNFRILDGGGATELARLGNEIIDKDPLWSSRLLLDNPEAIKTAHKNFLIAGADTVITVTYQASVEGFVQNTDVTKEEALDLIKKGVLLAREACQEVHEEFNLPVGTVAGSVGPYGACCHDGSEYTGTYIDNMTKQEYNGLEKESTVSLDQKQGYPSLKELIEWHKPRVQALLEAGVDILAVETIPAQKEAEAVLELLEEFPQSKAWVTFSCKDGSHTCHGELFSDAVKSVYQSSHVVAVGVNCTDPQYITSLLNSIKKLDLQKPVIVKPNSGEPWESGRGWYGKEDFPRISSFVKDWVDAGATWIGGCCRIFPQEITEIKDIVQKLQTAELKS